MPGNVRAILAALLLAGSAWSETAAPAPVPAPGAPVDSAAPADSALRVLPPLDAAVEVRMVPATPRVGGPFSVALTLRWEGPEMLLAAPRGWTSFAALEPLDRAETLVREIGPSGKTLNRRDFVLNYRPLREGAVDLSGLSILVARASGTQETLQVAPWRVEIGPEPLLPWWGWCLAALGAGAVALGLLRWREVRKARKSAPAPADPREELAARWRALKGRLRSSELDRSWLAEVSELARAALLLDGADPSRRTEEMANAKIAALEGGADSAAPSEAALRAAWKTVRQELVHSLYGGGLRPVGKNRETLRALRICLGLNDEETI